MVGSVEDSGDGMVEQIFESWPPRVSPEMLERRDQVRGDKRTVVWRDVEERIERDRMREIGRLDEYDIIDSCRRYSVHECACRVSVRVNEGTSLPRDDVLANEILEKCALAGACLSYEIEVLAAILTRQTDVERVSPDFAFGNDKGAFHGRKVSRSPKLVLEKSASPERALRVWVPISGLRSLIVQV